VYRAAIAKLLKKSTDHVLDGGCTTFENYRLHCGQIKGYREALAAFNETLKADDDD
jgi:hypothetical protein